MKSASIRFPSLICLVLFSVFTLFSCRNVSESGNDEAAVTAATPGPHRTPQSEPDAALSPPKLVVGIVVDQMRYEFLTRYMDRFGKGGFRRLLAGGYSFGNAKFNFVPTKTCPGHASIYTGATPSVHGIIGNSWYDESLNVKNGKMYCTYDSSARLVGGNTGAGEDDAGHESPKNMLSSTVSDELRLASGMRSVVLSISIKDRAAIISAGHLANAAYWLDEDCGCWVTSTYYYSRNGDKGSPQPELPEWVSDFNEKSSAKKFLEQPGIEKKWDTVFEPSSYTKTPGDNSKYKRSLTGKEDETDNNGKSDFPYDLSKALAENKDEFEGKWGKLIQYTPYGDSLTNEFAIAALKDGGLALGRDDVPDFLAVSYSSTDLVGHFYGPRSVEVEDTYLRLDRDIEKLLNALDEAVGEGNYLVFLTADHGVVDVPQYLRDLGMPAGYFDEDGKAIENLNKHLKSIFDTGDKDLVLSYTNQQVYLDRDLIANDQNLDLTKIQEAAASYMLTLDGVADVVTATELNGAQYTRGMRLLVQNGFYPNRSGDVAVILEPSWIEYSGYFGKKGTTHSQGYNYDTHVPLIFYGWKIKHGSSVRPVEITDIAPTVSALLGIPFPNGATGNPLIELFE
jgi:predicted AlkP superfamily pyrophosphatase or phosphodiesterase